MGVALASLLYLPFLPELIGFFQLTVCGVDGKLMDCSQLKLRDREDPGLI